MSRKGLALFQVWLVLGMVFWVGMVSGSSCEVSDELHTVKSEKEKVVLKSQICEGGVLDCEDSPSYPVKCNCVSCPNDAEDDIDTSTSILSCSSDQVCDTFCKSYVSVDITNCRDGKCATYSYSEGKCATTFDETTTFTLDGNACLCTEKEASDTMKLEGETFTGCVDDSCNIACIATLGYSGGSCGSSGEASYSTEDETFSCSCVASDSGSDGYADYLETYKDFGIAYSLTQSIASDVTGNDNIPIKNTKSGLIGKKDDGYTPEQEAAGGDLDSDIEPSWLASKLGITTVGQAMGLLTAVQYAVLAGTAAYLIGSAVGLSSDNTQALALAASVGWGLSGYLYKSGLFGKAASAWTGVGAGVVIFALMYKDTDTKTVTFSCLPWQAPSGGENCELCNDESLECTEYRCRSLGAGCELINEGTEDELCVYVGSGDINPPIVTPNEDFLTEGYEYDNVVTLPPGPGFEIVNGRLGEKCLDEHTTLTFGFTLDEPGQCKIDYNSTESYDDMVSYMGGSNLYSYNHTEVLNLPGVDELEGAGITLENGNEMTLYVRCQDKAGNTNEAEYAVQFCVDDSPDTTPPSIEATSIGSGSCVAEDVDGAEVTFYTNELAECRWDFTDSSYDEMDYEMDCSSRVQQINAAQLYSCEADLNAVALDGTDYYVKCKDQPGEAEGDRNVNTESYEFSLRGSNALLMTKISPNETIYTGDSYASVELSVETYYGCDSGQSVCYYSDDDDNYIMFYDTDNVDGVSLQELNLAGGSHTYYVKCVDGGGNVAINSTTFEIDVDDDAPLVARVYEEDGMLKLVTVHESECSYSFDDCDFLFDEGIVMPYANTTNHVADWDETETYYVKCRDEYQNEAEGCSIIVKPGVDFL